MKYLLFTLSAIVLIGSGCVFSNDEPEYSIEEMQALLDEAALQPVETRALPIVASDPGEDILQETTSRSNGIVTSVNEKHGFSVQYPEDWTMRHEVFNDVYDRYHIEPKSGAIEGRAYLRIAPNIGSPKPNSFDTSISLIEGLNDVDPSSVKEFTDGPINWLETYPLRTPNSRTFNVGPNRWGQFELSTQLHDLPEVQAVINSFIVM
ncbi:hypothetical protein HQ524_03470 [Candidatus Uhrbacteria bacterium]|nr:hypothetical protein [Candidatus Uhrbacteria bacterium]